MEFTDQQRKAIEAGLEKHTTNGKAITSGALYALLIKADKLFVGMGQTAFQPKLSKAVRGGEITGYEGQRKRGYFRTGMAPIKTVVKPAESAPDATIQVHKAVRLKYNDGNWTIEKMMVIGENPSPVKAREENVGETRWVSVGHYGTLTSVLEGLLTRHAYLLGVQSVTPVETTEQVKELLRTIRDGVAMVKRAVAGPAIVPQTFALGDSIAAE